MELGRVIDNFQLLYAMSANVRGQLLPKIANKDRMSTQRILMIGIDSLLDNEFNTTLSTQPF